MATKLWVTEALQILAESLEPVPHELNELDWKARLSGHKDRLAEHLMAFANHPSGDYPVFGLTSRAHPAYRQLPHPVAHVAERQPVVKALDARLATADEVMAAKPATGHRSAARRHNDLRPAFTTSCLSRWILAKQGSTQVASLRAELGAPTITSFSSLC